MDFSSGVSTMRLSEERITVVHRRRNGAIIGAALLGIFGIVASAVLSIIVCSRVTEGDVTPDLLLAPLTGLPFMVLAVFYAAILGRRWGTVELDRRRNTLLWLQGGSARGTWTLSDVARVERRHAFLHTFRVSTLGKVERWMSLMMKDGTRVPLYLGTGEELETIEEHLRRWGLPVR